MASAHLTLQQINTLDHDDFVAALGSIFEGPPWIVAETWPARPFASLKALHQALCDVLYTAPIERQVALLRAHPDLVGRAALAGTLTPASAGEQSSAGLDRLSPAEIAMFTQMNQAYRDTYGFPFVICARENKKDSILAGFNARLGHGRNDEIEIALAEVAKICWLRLQDLVEPDCEQD